jgi:primase-polymerase (primpol)-like protein
MNSIPKATEGGTEKVQSAIPLHSNAQSLLGETANTAPFVAVAPPQRRNWGKIPQELRDRPQWALAATDKAPRTANGVAASSTNPATWTDFETASRVADERGWNIGYMLSADDPFTCIDLDVKNQTTAEDIARFQSMIDSFASYTEVSRSGLGIHIWVRGKIGKGVKRDGVELYSQERFIICTANPYRDLPVADRQDMLLNMASQMRGAENQHAPLEDQPERESDGEVLQRAQRAANWEKFASLARGEWQSRYSSPSEADLAMMGMIAFFSPNNAQCLRIFRTTELGKREKAIKDDRYLNLTLEKVRIRQADERHRIEQQKAHFKQVGEGEIPPSLMCPPTLDLAEMLMSLVHITAEKPMVVFRDKLAIQLPPSVMASLLAHNTKEVLDKGKLKKVPLFTFWQVDKRRLQAFTFTFDPRQSEFCHAPDGRPALNLWKPRPHNPPADWQQRIQPFIDHVRYLIPEDAERERFLDWLAHIEQKPGEVPHAHYLMIATQQGVGRNWLSSLLACVWSSHVALDYDLKASLNNGFNGQLSRKLLAVVDEINEGGTGERWQHSEKLKSMVTTAERFINPKYGSQHSEVNCCRWLLFSNYESALPLHADDRRWNVIRNPSEPMGADYYSALYKTLSDKQFVASVREFLRNRDIVAFNPGARATMNAAKEAVVATSMTHEDGKAAELVASHHCDLVLAEDLFEAIYDTAPEYAPDASRRWARLAPIARKVGIEPMSKTFSMFGKPKQKVWILRNAHRWRDAYASAIEQELSRLDPLHH